MDAAVCAACRHENRERASFCEACGAALARRCGSCGTEARAGARFCDTCGSALDGKRAPAEESEPPSPAVPVAADRSPRNARGYTPRHLAERILTTRAALIGERKQVTVLFADVAGFTELSTRLDPEELHAVMDGCFERTMEAVHRYEGTVNQFTGDGMMALFGAPIAHEDHAVRAVAAALAIQKALDAYGKRVRADHGLEFAMRIGLNTGPVVVGKIGDDLRMDYTAQGETVNLAARLQSVAPPGGVLVGESTHLLVARRFEVESRGPFTLKGIARPVEAKLVTRERNRVLRFDVALERGLSPLVGRDGEVARLKALANQALQGQGIVASLVGDAGIGKSRLAHELARTVSMEFTVLRASCLPHRQAMPFHLVTQFLESTFAIDEGEPAERKLEKLALHVARLESLPSWTVPYLKHVLGVPADELEREGLDAGQRKRRTLESLKRFVFENVRRRPLLLVVEDLQWIDRSSEESLSTIVDGIGSWPMMMLATIRSGVAAPWEARTFHHRIAVGPLGRATATELVNTLLGEPGPSPLAERVVARAGGVPFFLEELAAYAKSGGSTSEDLPATVQGVVAARIDRLREPLKHALQLASVLGREFPVSLFEAMEESPEDSRSALADLVRLELLEERELVPEIRIAFGNPLLQEVAYESLLVRSRSELHERAGGALERLHADALEPVLADLARHYARSGNRERAAVMLVRAGDRAASLFAYAEADRCYREALAIASEESDERRALLTGKLGDAAFAMGKLREAIDRWTEALRLAGPNRRHAAHLSVRLAEAFFAGGERDAALAHLEGGLATLGKDLENLEAARLYQELGRIRFRLGDPTRAVDAATRALALGERLGAVEVVSHASNTLGLSFARSGELERAIEWVQKSLDAALAEGFASAACRAYTNLAVLVGSVDHARSIAYARDGLALAEKIGDQLQQAWLNCALASGHCSIEGDYEEGVLAAKTAIELDERLGQRSHLPIPLILLAQIHQCRGDVETSRRYYEQALSLAEPVGEPQLLIPCYDGLATLAIENENDDEAERWLEQGRRVGSVAGWASDASLLLPFLS